MKPIQKDELYNHLNQFLKTKGIELKDGTYPRAVQAGCSLLADVINLSQQGIERTRVEIDKNLDWMRRVIHEKTAPKSAGKKGTSRKSTPKSKSQPKRPKRAPAKR